MSNKKVLNRSSISFKEGEEKNVIPNSNAKSSEKEKKSPSKDEISTLMTAAGENQGNCQENGTCC